MADDLATTVILLTDKKRKLVRFWVVYLALSLLLSLVVMLLAPERSAMLMPVVFLDALAAGVACFYFLTGRALVVTPAPVPSPLPETPESENSS